jgi:uncharacterized protein (TIGR03083 family)
LEVVTMADAARVREALQLLRRESDAFVADLAALGPADWDRTTTCAPWTVRQLAGHIVRQVGSYTRSVEQALRGEVGAPEARDARTQEMNRIAAQAPAAIIGDLQQTNDQFERWFGALTPEQLDATGPHSHGPRSAAWFVDMRLAEVAFHRLDLERSLDRPADLDAATARHLLPTLLELNVPAVVRRDKTGGEGTYGLAVRGEPGAAWRLAFSPGALDVTRGSGDAAATFEADPAALALLIYGRASWPELEQAGRLSVSGSRAAAERFHTLFRGP